MVLAAVPWHIYTHISTNVLQPRGEVIGYSPKFILLSFYCYSIIIGHNYKWTSNSNYISQPICCEIWPMTTLLTMKSELNCVWQFRLLLKILIIFSSIFSLPFHNLESRHRNSSLIPWTRLMPCGIAEQHEVKILVPEWMHEAELPYWPGPLTLGLLQKRRIPNIFNPLHFGTSLLTAAYTLSYLINKMLHLENILKS